MKLTCLPELGGRIYNALHAIDYHRQRLPGKEDATHRGLSAGWCRKPACVPSTSWPRKTGSIPWGSRPTRFRNAGVAIVGIHTNPQIRVHESGPPEFRSNERFGKRRLRLSLPAEMYAYGVRRAKPARSSRRFTR